MKNLTLPSRDLVREHLKISIYKYKYAGKEHGHELSEKDIEKIVALYDLYDKACGVAKNDFKGNGLAKSLLKAIQGAYNQTYEGKKLYSIRQELFSGIVFCPICGIEPVTQLDHHLPESVFNPLAIYVRNLIPLCQPCNFAKLAGFGGEDGKQPDFIHAYFDILPDVQFLKADIAIIENGILVEFGILKGIGLTPDHENRLSAQFIELKLNTRYQKEVNAYLSGQAISLHTNFLTSGAKGVRAFLKAQAKHQQRAFYQNHWQPILLNALADHNKFVDGGFSTILPVDKDIIEDLMAEND